MYLNSDYKKIVDGLLNTGARVTEFWFIVRNPDYYKPSRRLYDLPKIGACKKPKCKTTDRTILLSSRGAKVLDGIYADEIEYRDPTCIQKALKRAALKAGFENLDGINSKMYRKMAVSWLLAGRKHLGIDSFDITASMGHSSEVMLKDYAGMKFSDSEVLDMVTFFSGWGK
jgi:integrase